ncbi:bile acid:sodium symporter family protein [Rhodococcus sp. G-MC3]|uniref:bile acid:sodium symporter family protein n=1 Tax=Rhodococcus sp. G-MC3 TaxID=3046209 RepID=UPI0024BAE063|nr:bile acid:sodium symporter family protein [Rhodococcus sp. G-MC3]MDJ0393584.1 bile acid:sodium symporter family protein [Rhodococcus sp. G-MC3]
MNFLRDAKPDGFVLGIIGVAAAASIFPATGTAETILGWVTKIAIGLLFLIYGARLSPQQAWQGVKHWRLHSVVLVTTYVLFPLIGLALRILEPSVLSAELYTGILFLCLVPSTVQSSIAFTSIAKGNVAGAVVSASFSNILGVFITPLLVILLVNTSGEAHVDASSILNILAQLLLPFIAGQLIRPLVARWLARHSGPTRIVDRGSILLVVYSAFSESMNQHVWSAVSVWQIVAVVLVCCVILAAVLTLTHFIGRAMGFPLSDRIVLVFCGSKKSLASGLPMASVLFIGQPVGLIVLPLLLFHQIQLVVCAVLAQRYARHSPIGNSPVGDEAESAVHG